MEKKTLLLGGKSVANPGFLGTYEEYGSTKQVNFLLTMLVLSNSKKEISESLRPVR
jgi:hypothetical protein